MEATEPEEAAREAIQHWWRLQDLAGFAEQGHGYGDSNGGFGVTYPADLDEYDRVIRGDRIPDGFVRAYGFWGPPAGYAVLIPETEYLGQLTVVLSAAGHAIEAARVLALIERKHAEPNHMSSSGDS